MRKLLSFLLFTMLFLFGNTPLQAAIHNIQVGNNFFAPLKTTVNYGDTVRWVWSGGIPHSTTSDISSAKQWDSGVSSTNGFTYDVVFTPADGAGPFPYHCSIHSLSMKDTIFVAVIDNDEDGFPEDVDCDDGDSTIFPGADEIPDDGVDQDCNGFDAVTCYIDSDNDGFGDSSDEGTINPEGVCATGFSLDNSDCNDSNPSQPPCGCCIGIRGNIDGLGGEPGIDIGDLVFMVEYQFLQGPQPSCLDEADIDGTPGIDIGDLVFMALYQFDSGAPPPSCN